MANLKKIFFLIASLFLFSFLSFSQDSVEGKIINKIYFHGLKKAKKREIKNSMQTQEGMPLDLSLIEQDQQTLFSLDYFKDIKFSTDVAYNPKTNQPIPGKLDLIIDFYEKPTIRKILFSGNRNLSYGVLINEIKTKRGEFLKKGTILADISLIKDKYAEKGFNYAVIDYKVIESEELKKLNQIDVKFVINEGTESHISDIIFEGNKKISTFTLKGKMKTKKRGPFGLIKGSFVESKFNQDIEELRKYYKDQGYYFSEILDPEIEHKETKKEDKKFEQIIIRIKIKEGKQYRYGGLILKGNKIFSDEDLTFGLKLKPGAIFNYSKFTADIYSIRNKYTNSGYVQTQIQQDAVVNEEKNTVSFVLTIVESSRSYIEEVYFRGNTKTKNYVLERAVSTEVGQIFDSSKLMGSLIGLYNLGFFSKVDYDIQPGSAPGLLKVGYIVEEQSTAEIRFGMTITTNKWPPDITFFAEITERNWLGRQLTLGGKVDVSVYKQGFEFKLDDPWFLSYPWSMGTSLKFYHTWNYKILKKFTMQDYELYHALGGSKSNPTESDLRDYFNSAFSNNDASNPNYVNANGDITKMGMHTLSFEFDVRSGYRFLKYFYVSGDYSLIPTYSFLPYGNVDDIYYDSYRNSILSNDGWSFKSSLSATFAINTTKRRLNPYQGIKYSLTATYTGIGGTYDYFYLSSKFTAYWKILDLYFNDWPFKNVLVFNAGVAAIFPGFRNLVGDTAGGGPILSPQDYLTVDGFFIGRGWTNSIGATNFEDRLTSKQGFVRFDFSLEYRVPIHEKFIWLAGFIDLVNLVEGPSTQVPRIDSYGDVVVYDGAPLYNTDRSESWKWWAQADAMSIDNWYGSIGFGFELTFPQLPLSFFIVKRFKISRYAGFEWVNNQPDSGNLDFVLSIVGYYF